jgi:hypothetical protein
MPRPALPLDVDGVLNPYGSVKCPAGFTEYDLFPGEEPVRLCPAHGEWINELQHGLALAWSAAQWTAYRRRGGAGEMFRRPPPTVMIGSPVSSLPPLVDLKLNTIDSTL